ncbi:OmpA family protein [Candidatus Marithioploca araucensis]|uniref:OmpA family protein n=1 Tax=Candidatus Marithioploca araucensis TaxID=70273 RepID=A0ABT7VUR6_9GAMM|nr:OmpA family protein [Candidatus Marithioploca araucensis]
MRNKLVFFLFILFLGNGCATLPKPPMTAIQKAENLVEQNQMPQAEQLLDKYRKTWKTQAIRGDIAAYRGQWQVAARFFQESLNLAKAETAYPEPAYDEKERIYRSFEEAQLLAGETVSSLVEPPNDPTKSAWQIKKMRIPVEFKTNGWKVNDATEEGKESIKKMADYLNEHNVRKVTVIGHTDERGKASYNKWLSEQRAKSIHQYLSKNTQTTNIESYGKGEDEPLRPLPRWGKNWKQDEIDQRDRRVELIIKY